MRLPFRTVRFRKRLERRSRAGCPQRLSTKLRGAKLAPEVWVSRDSWRLENTQEETSRGRLRQRYHRRVCGKMARQVGGNDITNASFRRRCDRMIPFKK